ncbi:MULTISPECIES: DUF1697 domain-containing protein [Streptomyces]|uniref:DUF1697 domain-containing protein n=1 Tax=Streptomyces TaxID=1883 RepID=UPI0006ADE22D|nr:MULTISPECIES: DUF1697 domain-containing protein [Streptomyces]KOU00936.1 hypothetical protein ADK88_32470 [Streptomyces sp. NRRL F-2295]MCC0575386.1 DUF1697 domain-containing protein [Streptomyces californicus]MDW4913852.1 DUF1697 domain-containing protein [Streptomyces californicus]
MTTTYAALLRGINVSGSKRVPMAELRTVLTELGHTGIATYLQSGNAVFRSDGDDENALSTALEQALHRRFGFTVDCLVRDAGYLAAVAEACPFPAAELEGRQLHVTYFDRAVDAERFADLEAGGFLPEEFRLGDRCLYLYAPDGLGRSKLAEALARPRHVKGLTATTRNWNTVAKLVELTRD